MENIFPKFPVFDIDYKGCTDFIIDEPIFWNEFYYSNSDQYFLTNILNHKVVDINGNTFRIVGKKNLKSFWKYLPFKKKAVFLYETVDEKYTLENLKVMFLRMIEDPALQVKIQKAENIEDLFLGN